MTEILSSETVFTKLERIAKVARQMPGTALTSLSHHIDIEWLREAFRRTRKDGAAGVDRLTAKEYEKDLERNLQGLLDRMKSGTYRAPPVRRVHIPKGDGSQTRPIGIPTFEDKVLQRAVVMALEAVYEQDFLDCSYGFRPGRSAHHALQALRTKTIKMGGGWILEVDIKGFFDNLDHAHLREMLQRRVRDGVILRLIGKWLNAGVLENGEVSRSESGTPQGGVISPLLANIYLHEVLDTWFARGVELRRWGAAELFRYADDFVIVFEEEEVARRVLDRLTTRFAEYGLTLHPEKTRLVEFKRPPTPPSDGDRGSGGTFDFLGFTHRWDISNNGKWVVERQTAKDRFSRALKRVTAWCKEHRHDAITEQWKGLQRKLRGHYGYFGIIGNSNALWRFRDEARRIWAKWLRRRSQRPTPWKRVAVLLQRFELARPKHRLRLA